jgi:hypothetical protein
MLIVIGLLLKSRDVDINARCLHLGGRHLRPGYLNPPLGDIYLGGKYYFVLLNLVILASMLYIQRCRV